MHVIVRQKGSIIMQWCQTQLQWVFGTVISVVTVTSSIFGVSVTQIDVINGVNFGRPLLNLLLSIGRYELVYYEKTRALHSETACGNFWLWSTIDFSIQIYLYFGRR